MIEFISPYLSAIIAGVSVIALIVVLQKGNPNIRFADLITDWNTGRLEYKKVGLNTCLILQCFTWGRMSMGYEVHPALENPYMWVVFYIVVAGQDLLEQFIKVKADEIGLKINKAGD